MSSHYSLSDDRRADLAADNQPAGGTSAVGAEDARAPASPPAGADAAPGWFQAKQARSQEADAPPKQTRNVTAAAPANRSPKAPPPPAATLQEMLEEEDQLLSLANILDWIRGYEGAGYGISLVFHIILLLLLAIVIVPGLQGPTGLDINAREGEEGETTDFDDIIDSSLDLQTEIEMVEPTIVHVPDSAAKPIEIATSANIQANVSGDGDGDGSAVKLFGMAPGSNAVTAGSFTAWTVPEDPKPLEDYRIVVRIRLPKRIRRYPVADISGMVIGTDSYRQAIPGNTTLRFLKVVDNYTQFDVRVPGAASLVRDRIEVRSKLLNESQVLEITF